MWKDILTAPTSYRRRRVILEHFLLLFVDALDLPFWMLAAAMFVTIWRAPSLYQKLSNVMQQR